MTSASVKITILVDNRAGDGLIAEHGLSLWIETEGKHILFDTGQGRALQRNAEVLGVDVGKTDILVLSNGHYDHSGGVSQVLQRAQKADIYCHPAVVNPRYAIRSGTPKSIQMPRKSMTAIDRLPSQHVHWVQQPIILFGKIGITGPIPRETGYEDTGGPFYLDVAGRRPDPIDDDLALWIRNKVVPCHCTGEPAVACLLDAFEERVLPGAAGRTYQF